MRLTVGCSILQHCHYHFFSGVNCARCNESKLKRVQGAKRLRLRGAPLLNTGLECGIQRNPLQVRSDSQKEMRELRVQ